MHDSRTWRQRTGVKTLSHPPTLLAFYIHVLNKFFIGNIKMYLQFISFLHIMSTLTWQELVYSAYIKLSVVPISWPLASPGHQHPWSMILTVLNGNNSVPTAYGLKFPGKEDKDIHITHVVNIMAADDLVMSGTVPSAAHIRS